MNQLEEKMMLEKITINDFKPYLNQTFLLQLNAAQYIELQLIQISELGIAPQDESARRAFSLLFRAPMQSILPQRIYSLAHPEMGTLDLFLVPIGPDQEGMQYEALFA